MPVYTPSGLEILTKWLNKEKRASALQVDNLPKLVGVHFTFFKFLDLLVECALTTFSDPFFSENRL